MLITALKVLSTAAKLCVKMDYTSPLFPNLSAQIEDTGEEAAGTSSDKASRQASASVRSARARMKAQMKAEGLQRDAALTETVQIAGE